MKLFHFSYVLAHDNNDDAMPLKYVSYVFVQVHSEGCDVLFYGVAG